MTLNRHTVGALTATAAVLVGAGAALAASPTAAERSGRCETRVARIAERRGVTVEQLTTNVKARLLARIDAAEKAGRITAERADNLRVSLHAYNNDDDVDVLLAGLQRHRGLLAGK